ncbi:MAG: spore maturation protein [Clostridiales bacterium]|nr:spore maturation protein [Clostridia bacterium]MDI9512655.1 spore maturation protein [Bacillota bacterium]NLH58089.1 spore maturation protein [Clostridiales bacterium]
MLEAIKIISVFAIPLFFIFILAYGHFKGIAVYDTFIEGAKEGLTTAFRIVPYLVAMFVAIGIFRSSGAMDMVTELVKPIFSLLGGPPEVLPLFIMRPMSGAASLGILAELLKVYGPDSIIGRTASTAMGSTETTFYTISVYLGAVGIKNARYALAAGLIADMAGFIASIIICNVFF